MPADKDLKRLIRARMARTSESYSTARRHTLMRPGRQSRQGPSAGREGDPMQRTTFETGIEDGRRLVTARDVPTDYVYSLVEGLEFGITFTAEEAEEAEGVGDADDAGDGREADSGVETGSCRFVWEYPAGAPSWPDAARNWVADGPEVLDQRHGVRPADWEGGLAWIAGILDGIEADWFLIGSGALAVRGMDVRPGGIDIALDEAGADRLGPHVGAGVLRPVIDSGGWEVATRSGLLFHGCSISIAGGLHDQEWPRPWDTAARAALETVTWRDRSLRVPPLRAMLVQARMMQRNDHLRAILAHSAHRPDSADPT
jgi:hypothetical protein